MFATKLNSTTLNNRNTTLFSRRPIQGSAPIAPAAGPSTSSRKNQNASNSSNINSSIFSPAPQTDQGSSVLPGLNPKSWQSVPPSSTSRRSTHNNSSRSWTNPYQTLTAGGRKKFHQLRQKLSRVAAEDNSAIPSFLKILNVPANKQKVTRFFAAALERKVEKLKKKAMKQNSGSRALYRGPKLNWIEIQALERQADEEDGNQVVGGNETGVSGILQQTGAISCHVPQVVMPGVQRKSGGDVNDGDTDPGTDTDDEGGDTDGENEDKENVNPGAEPKTPINTCGPSNYRATIEDVDDEEQITRTPCSGRPQTSATEDIFTAPRKRATRGDQVFPQPQSWGELRSTESVMDSRCKTANQTTQPNAVPSTLLSSSTINASQQSQDQQQTQLPQPRSFQITNRTYPSQEQRTAGPSLDAFSSTNAQQQQTSESQRSYFTDRAQSVNLQQSCFSFPASVPSYPHFLSNVNTQPPASQSLSQSAFPILNPQPPMPQAFSSSGPENTPQPQIFTQVNQSAFRQDASFNGAFHPPAQSMPSFQLKSTSSQLNFTAFQAQQNTGASFPSLEATFAYFSIPPFVSRPINRRLPVLAPDDPPNRPILFGPHGIKAFLKEKPIPVEEDAPLPLEPLENFDYDAWNEKIKQRCEEFEARRSRSGPLGKLPPPHKKNYVGKPPRGSEEDLIRRLELQKKYEVRKPKKRVRFLLPDDPPRKRRRVEESVEASTLLPAKVPRKRQHRISKPEAEADPVVPGAYDIQWDNGRVTKWEKPRQCPNFTGLLSFLFGNSAAEENPV